MSKKKSRIKQTKTEWQKMKETVGMKPQSWHQCLPELLHISIGLIDNEFEKVKYDFMEFCKVIRKVKSDDKFYGNLSNSIDFLYKHNSEIGDLKENIIYNSIKHILVFYSDIFHTVNLQFSEIEPLKVFKGYKNIIEMRGELTIACKFIFINNVYNNDTSPLQRIISSYDDVIDPNNSSLINSAWLVISMSENVIDYEFTDLIWFFNYLYIPVMQKDDEESEKKRYDDFNIDDLKIEFVKYSNAFKEIPLFVMFARPFAELTMGFINRSIYLTNEVVELVSIHKGEIAEAVLRMLYEHRLKYLWLLKRNDITLFIRFREYSSGREKLFIDKLPDNIDQDNLTKFKKAVDDKLDLEGYRAFEIATERGGEFEIGIDKMADELGVQERLLYDSVYKRTSDIIHGSWRSMEKYHLVRSNNPMHDRLLYYNNIEKKFSGMLPTFTALMFGSEILYKFMETFNDDLTDYSELMTEVKGYNVRIKEILRTSYIPSIL